MEGEYLATRAMACACAGLRQEAQTSISESQGISSQVDASAWRDFARVVLSQDESGVVDQELQRHALLTAKKTGHFDSFVCAYRAFPALLEGLLELNSGDVTPLDYLVSQLDPNLAEKFGLRSRSQRSRPHGDLTRRENEVFELMRQGLSNRQIGRTLWISESTVKVHVHNVLAKLGARSRTEAIAVSLEED
jgi:DNA-binding NarL/FixJ family response regulator